MALLYVCDRCDRRDPNSESLCLEKFVIKGDRGGTVGVVLKAAEICKHCRIELARWLEPIPKGPIVRG